VETFCGGSKQKRLDSIFDPTGKIFESWWDSWDYRNGIKQENAWVCVEFTQHKLLMTHYTLAMEAISQPRAWIVEASNDGRNWTRIHTVENYPPLRTKSAVRTFEVAVTEPYSFIRFRMTRNYTTRESQKGELRLCGLDFYGKLLK
jgi:hypothetical protein